MVKRNVVLLSLIYTYKYEKYITQEVSSTEEACSRWAISDGNNLKHA